MVELLTRARDLPRELVEKYKQRAIEQANARGLEVVKVDVYLKENGKIGITTLYGPSTIKRVRRVTGYFAELVNFNDAKLAEYNERVPHF